MKDETMLVVQKIHTCVQFCICSSNEDSGYVKLVEAYQCTWPVLDGRLGWWKELRAASSESQLRYP
jgi:hypothetical protein